MACTLSMPLKYACKEFSAAQADKVHDVVLGTTGGYCGECARLSWAWPSW